MYTPISYPLSKPLVFVVFFAMQLLLIRSVLSLNLTNAYLQHKCLVKEGKYKPGSEFEKNLNFLTRRLSAHTYPDGFRHTSYGESPNTVTIVFQCRGDSYRDKCRSCFATAVAGLRRRCPSYKGAIIWYDQCFLDVSTISNPPEKIDYENTFTMHNPKNVNGDKESFNKNTRDFLYKLAIRADESSDSNTSSLTYYAAGEKMVGTKNLYAMVQCAQDIYDCKGCLKWSINKLPKCCNGKQGARVLGTSCNLRYELYPFIKT